MIVDNKDRNSSSMGAALHIAPASSGQRRHRPGATLLEVLVAIFIMGIGLMALLVLFPLGALRMAAAIRSDRAAQAAVTASAIANVKDIRRDAGLGTDYIYKPSIGKTGDHFLNPVPGVLTDADFQRRSYPILVDPVGYYTAAGLPAQKGVGNLTGGNLLLARRPVSFTPAAGVEVYKWFTQQDDIVFEKDGSAKSIVAGAIEREVGYSYAYLLQRPRTSDPSVVECTVVVYAGRPVGLSGNLDLSEFPYYLYDNGSNTSEVTFDPTINSIRIRYGALFGKAAPPIRPGDWVLDVSRIPRGDGTFDRHGFFNRVAGITEGVDYVDLEMQQPLRGFTGVVDSHPTNANGGARLLFMEGVAEVYERGLGKEP